MIEIDSSFCTFLYFFYIKSYLVKDFTKNVLVSKRKILTKRFMRYICIIIRSVSVCVCRFKSIG